MSERKRSVRMTDDEAWAFVHAGHTGILTTLRRDGRPIALPVWYVTLDRRIYVHTRGKKVLRARRDPRVSFLVEAGERWAELQAVHLECEARVLDEPGEDLAARIAEETARKYAAFRTRGRDMPKETKAAYDRMPGSTIELVPVGKLLTWDNNHLGLG